MKYSQATQSTILELSKQGFSGRQIAHKLGLSKSGVNKFLKSKQKDGPKILILDVETAATLAYCFGRWDINLSQDNISKEGGWILCFSYRWLGSDKVQSRYLTRSEVKNMDDSRIVLHLFDLFEQADFVVAHNGKSFDHKVIQTRVLANDLPPLPTVKIIDTKLIAKKYLRLPSNKLDSIGEYFGLGRKLDTSGIKLWIDVQSGDTEAMKNMVEYCEQDVNLLYDVFLKVAQLGLATDINLGLYFDDTDPHCVSCGSTDIEATGRTVKTSVSEFNEFRCNDCGSVMRDRKSITTKEKRKNLLARAY